MNYEIRNADKRTVAGFHLVGPWEQTVKQGFDQLMMWVDGKQVVAQEWIAVYFDNPDEVPAEKLRCSTVVSVPADFCHTGKQRGRNAQRNRRWSICDGGCACRQ